MALKGVKVIELAGMAPSPLCGMILSDYGASVIRVDRTGPGIQYDVTARGKRSIAINLKDPKGIGIVKKLCNDSDVFIEGFRAGVMEKLGLGPDILMKQNPRLIYARLTGYGQEGPYSKTAGHDINYLATSGILSRLGRKTENPHPPVNLLADFAGGSMTCAMGIMASLFERSHSGKGQIIDSNMVEGAAYVGSWIYKSQKKMFVWGKNRGENILDGGAHFYETYETLDNKYVAVGAIEPQFYNQLLDKLGLSMEELPHMPEMVGSDLTSDDCKAKLAEVFRKKTRDEWAKIFDGTDACVTPILELEEAPEQAHNKERGSFILGPDGEYSPVPAPRLSRTPAVAQISETEPEVGQHTFQILTEELGYTPEDVRSLQDGGTVECLNMKAKL